MKVLKVKIYINKESKISSENSTNLEEKQPESDKTSDVLEKKPSQ